jgi:hypothetical protein
MELATQNVAAIDQLLIHLRSMEAVVSTESDACAAPKTARVKPKLFAVSDVPVTQ